MKQLTSILAIIILTVFAIFTVQNLDSAKIRFLSWSVDLSLAIPMLGAYLLGGLTLRPVIRLLRKDKANRRAVKDDKKAAHAKKVVAAAEAAKDEAELAKKPPAK